MTDVEQPPSKQALKDMPLPALLAAIALVLGSIAAIFVALATIDKNGKDAIHAMLVVFEWSGGFAMFMSYFAPFFYIQRKWLATLVAIARAHCVSFGARPRRF